MSGSADNLPGVERFRQFLRGQGGTIASDARFLDRHEALKAVGLAE
jgi:hypothetical protein